MITIKKILGNEQFDVLVQKINDNFTQIAELNGGPRGKFGKQGFPGLPGLQGRQGFAGNNGTDGNRFFLVGTSLDIPSLPPESSLASLILDKTYVVGDCFVHYDISITDHAISKITEDTPGHYTYYTYKLTNGTETDFLWIRHQGTPIYGISANRTFLARDTDDSSLGYLQNTYVDFRSTQTPTEALGTLQIGSAGISLLGVYNKSNFKFGITQSTPTQGSVGSGDLYTQGTIAGRIPNMYSIIDSVSTSYSSLTVWDGSQFNDPTSGDGGGSNLSVFDYIRSAAPVLYLQGNPTNKDGVPIETSDFTNFGFLLQKVDSTTRFGTSSKKSILILVSDSAGNNDVYFKQNKVWSDGSFISEINRETQNRGDRFYSAVITPSTFKAGAAVNTRQKVNLGLSTYFNNGVGSGIQLKLMTGFETINNASGAYHYGTINGFLSNNLCGSSIKTDILTTRTQFMRVDVNGNIAFMSTKESGINAYDNITLLSAYNTTHLIRSGERSMLSSILRVADTETIESAFVVSLRETQFHHSNIGAGFDLKDKSKSGSFFIKGYDPDDNLSYLYEHRVVPQTSTVPLHNYGYYSGIHAQLSNPALGTYDAGFAWGITNRGSIPAANYSMGISSHTTGLPNQNSYTWIYKKWNTHGYIVSYNKFMSPIADNTVNEEVGLVLEKSRLQMNIGDDPFDTSDLTDKIMASRTDDGEATWIDPQEIVDRHSHWNWWLPPESAQPDCNMPYCSFTNSSVNDVVIEMLPRNHKFVYIYSSIPLLGIPRDSATIYLPGVPYTAGPTIIDDKYNGMELEFLLDGLMNPTLFETFSFRIINANLPGTGAGLGKRDALQLTTDEWNRIKAGEQFYCKFKLLKYGSGISPLLPGYAFWWKLIERKFIEDDFSATP